MLYQYHGQKKEHIQKLSTYFRQGSSHLKIGAFLPTNFFPSYLQVFPTDLILPHICTNDLYRFTFSLLANYSLGTFQGLSLHSWVPAPISLCHSLYLLEAVDTLDHGLLYEVMRFTLTSKGLHHLAPTHASYLKYHSFPTAVYCLDKLDFLLLPFHPRGVPIPVGLPLTRTSTGHKSYRFTPIAFTCQEPDDHYQFALSPTRC